MSIIVSAAGVLSIGLVGAAVILEGGTLLRLTYGPEFSRYWPAAELFALSFLISSIGLGAILVLKTTRNTRALFRVQLATLVVSVAAVSTLAVTNGVSGAAAASIVTSAANLAGLMYFGRRAHKQLLAAEQEGGAPSDTPAPVDQIRNNDTPISVEFG